MTGTLPATIPIHLQIGDADRETIGEITVGLQFDTPDEDTATSTGRPADPAEVGRQVADLLEQAAAELREQYGPDPTE